MAGINEQLAALGITAETAAALTSQITANNPGDNTTSNVNSHTLPDASLGPENIANDAANDASDWATDAPAMSAARQAQEEKWKNSQVDVRQQLSNREALLSENIRKQMMHSIQDFHIVNFLTRKLIKLPPEVLMIIVEFSISGGAPLIPYAVNNVQRARLDDTKSSVDDRRERVGGFRICVRKRPMLKAERGGKEYSVVNCGSSRSVLLHDAKVSRSGNRLSMSHKRYYFDHVFDEVDDNETVTSGIISKMYSRCKQGSNSTLICYGQTGTGKTYTLMGALKKLGELMEEDKADNIADIIFLELHGKKAYDLLSDRKVIRLLSDENNIVHARGAESRTIALGNGKSTSEMFHDCLENALNLRSVEVTERNPISSRSHAVFTLKFGNSKLTLVDLAGSERNYETVKMTPQQHRESAEINKALMALKDCIRAKRDGQLLKYRAHLLTRVLRDCFVDEKHTTTIIATVSCTTCDCLHTINTLEHISLMMPPLEDKKVIVQVSSAGRSERGNIESVTIDVPLVDGCAALNKPVEAWTASEVKSWIAVADGGKFSHIVLPPNLTGEKLMMLNETSLMELFQREFNAGATEARGLGEGSAWVAGVEEGEGESEAQRDMRQREIGRALWGALRMEQKQALGNKCNVRT